LEKNSRLERDVKRMTELRKTRRKFGAVNVMWVVTKKIKSRHWYRVKCRPMFIESLLYWSSAVTRI